MRQMEKLMEGWGWDYSACVIMRDIGRPTHHHAKSCFNDPYMMFKM